MAKLFLRQKKSKSYRLYSLTAVSLGIFISTQSVVSKEEKHQNFKHQFNLGLEVQHYHYKEPDIEMTDDGVAWMEQKARMGGVNL